MRQAESTTSWIPLAAFLIVLVGSYLLFSSYRDDSFSWPESARTRIENEAAIIRRIKGPAKWCSSSVHKDNLLQPDLRLPDDVYSKLRSELRECLTSIEPASDFIEKWPGEYMKRFYRAETNEYVCEATLSTVRNADRLVGADCYYGLFLKETAPPIGATDDPFG